MIGQLTGILLETQPQQVLIDTHGLGYEVQISSFTLDALPDVGSQISLLIHSVIREDAHTLYGFSNKIERSLFRALIKVNGVGPKLALSILSSMLPEDFIGCVRSNDSQRLVKLPGIGKKTAERLVIEMQDALKDEIQISGDCFKVSGIKPFKKPSNSSVFQEVTNVLIALGYKSHEFSPILSDLRDMVDSKPEEIVKTALQKLGRMRVSA